MPHSNTKEQSTLEDRQRPTQNSKEDDDQESIQSSTTLDQRHHMRK